MNPQPNTDIPGVISDHANCSIADLFAATAIPPARSTDNLSAVESTVLKSAQA